MPNALGSKESKYPSFFQKSFEYPFPPLRYFFYPFLICGVLKKAIFPPMRSKMTITPNFLKKIIQDFLYGRCGFSTEISNKNFEPTNENFDSKSNNFLGKFKFSKSLKSTNFDPRCKKIFFSRTQLPHLLPLTYHKFMTTFYFFFSELSQKNYFFPKTLFFTTKILFGKKNVFSEKTFWS